MKGIHKLTIALLSVVVVSTCNTTFATSMTIDVEGTDSASHSGAISVGTLNKTDAGSLALSGTNAIGNLAIQGGKVSVSSAGNLNGASSAVTFAASGTDPVRAAANTATLQIAGSMNTGAFAFSTAGTVQVDGANVATLNAAPTGTGLVHKTGPGVMKIASDLGPQTVACTFDTVDGYYKNGAARIAWPSNFTTFSNDLGGSLPSYSGWNTADTYDRGVYYGGIRLYYFGGTSYTGSPFYYYTDSDISAVHPTTVIPTPIAGIHVDAGTLYVQSGKAPNAPIQIASGAVLQLAGVSTAASGTGSEIKSALTVQSGGSIVVDASKKVSASLTTTVTYTLDASDGRYKNGSDAVAWPAGFTSVYTPPAYSSEIHWNGNVYGHNDSSVYVDSIYYLSSSFLGNTVTYAGMTLECGWLNNHRSAPLTTSNRTYRLVYTGATTYLGSANSDSDAALSGTVLMESGSSIVLGAGSNWACA